MPGLKLVIYGYCVTQGPERQSPSSAELGDPRARILDSATREFARSGFNGTSLERIAAGAGLSKAGVLHHFAGKAAATCSSRWTRASSPSWPGRRSAWRARFAPGFGSATPT